MNNKLTSRKFWMCVAATLGSIASAIAGIAQNNPTLTTIGTICAVLSTAIYTFCEAWVDGKAVEHIKYEVIDDTDPLDEEE